MALKQVVDTTKNTYLTNRFEDDEGNQYGDAAVKSLVTWYRFDGTTNKSTATITYTGQPSDGNTLTLISTDGTSKTYEFESGGGVTAPNVAVTISTDDADATYSALRSAILSASGHNGKITVTHTDDNNNAGTITFTQSVGGSEGNTAITGTIANTSALPTGFGLTAGSPSNLSINKFYDDENPPALIDVSASYGTGAAPGPTLSTEKIGEILYNAATFDGANDHIDIGTAVEWDHIIGNESSSSKKMTFSFWIYKTGDGGGNFGRIVDFGAGDLQIYTNVNEAIFFTATWNGSSVAWNAPVESFSLNTWTHIAVTYDANSIHNNPVFYVNGVKFVDDTPTDPAPSGSYSGITTDPVFIGNNISKNRGFEGKLAEFCIWNQVLSHENIKAMYNVSQVRFTRNQTVSGFLNHSPRIQSIENINYHDVHGKFDDTRTIDFIDPRQVAVLKIKKRPGDARTITITDLHDATGNTSGAHSASAVVTYTGQPSDTNVITLVSTDGTTKTYEFESGGGVTAGNVSVAISTDDADATYAALKTAVEGSSGHNGKILVTHTDDNNNAGTITFKQLLGGLPGNSTITATVAQATVPAKFTGASSPTTGATTSASKTFEFQRGVILNAGNVEINIKDVKTPAQVARKIVSAINSNTTSGTWSFSATQTKPDEVTIIRNRIDGASACTITTTAPERFIEVTKKFAKKIQPVTVYPSLEIADSVHILERKNYGGSTRSDIEIVRPVSRITPLRPKSVQAVSPFNEAHAHAAFGFEEGIEAVSPEKDIDSGFYVSGSASAIGPEGVKNRKKIVLDMPVSQNTDLQLVTNASPRTETNSNFPMAYYNFTDKTWQKIGLGSGSFAANPAGTAAERQTQFNQALDFTMVGFTPSKGLKAWRVSNVPSSEGETMVGFEKNGTFELAPEGSLSFRNGSTQNPRVVNVGSLASPTNVFGFPAHPKFHATESQRLSMSSRITKPFVLEKIVYEFNVGMKSAALMSTLSSDTTSDSVTVDFDTVTFFMLNQREAAVGKELSEVPKFRVADSDAIKAKLSEAVTYTNPICPSGKEIPRKIQLTPHNVSGSAASIDETEVSTIRDLVTWSRLTSSPSGFNPVLLDALAKDVRKDSDLVLNPDDNTYPFGSSRKISYTEQPADGATVKLVSSDGTIKTYEFESSGGVTAGNVSVTIAGNADATYAALKTAVLSASGHNGKILVSHESVGSNASGDIIFHMGPKKYSISAECIAPVVQITSGSIDVGAAALGEIASTVAYFGITNTTVGAASKPPVNAIDASPPTGQTITLSKVSIGRTLAGLQSGRSLVGENPSSSHLYTFRGLKNGDAKITAYEKDFGASPYIILPNDKLVIGCQAPINSALDGTHPEIRLGSGDGRIILYGYELEKEHPSYKDFSKDSTGSSEFLSENIGDISVRDEFETHPRMTYYRSSIDEVVTGSMLFNSVGTDFGTSQQADARQVVGRNSQGTQGEVGSLLRARKLLDSSERYYDSMVPDLRNLMQADSVNTVDLTGNSNSGIVLGVAGSDATYKSLDATGVQAGTKVIWDNWFSSFPFEARYNSISTARLPSIRKSIPTKSQTGATKSNQIKTTVDHVALALFENTGTLGVVGNVAGTYTSTAILDNPTISENTNRLVPGGRSSSLFVNTPTLSNTEVYVSWTAQDVAATGSIQFPSTLNTLAEIKSLNMKTLSVPFLATGQTSTVSEDFVFAHLDDQTNDLFYPGTAGSGHKLGEVKVSVSTPPVLTISYDDSVQVSDFADMLVQLPTTGSAADTSALKLFLDSAGTDATGNKTTASTLDNATHVNKGSLSAMGTSDTVLNDMWTTGSVVQIAKTVAAVDIVNTSGAIITTGGVSINTPILLFNDSAGNESQRFIDLDRLVNSYDKDDVGRTTAGSLVPPDNEMSLSFKHARGVNTSVHPTLNEPPDTDEDIQVELSYGVAATANIYVEGRTENASSSKTPEKGAITITSTDGTVRKYVITDTIAGGSGGGVATGTRLISTTDTGTGQAGTDNVGAIAVGINITGSSTLSTRTDYLTQLKDAIQHANGHNGKITVGSVTVDGDNAYITLTQSKAGPSGNTTIVKSVEATNIASTSTTFSGGSNRNATDFAIWGNTIDHSADSRQEGFISNDFRLGHSLKINVNGFGRLSSTRIDAFTDDASSSYTASTGDYIKFALSCTESGQLVDRFYQFFPVDESGGLTPTFTYSSGAIINATANLAQQAASETTFTYAFKSGVNNGVNETQNLTNDLARARKLAEAINAASRFEDQTGHEKGRFCALVSQDSSNTYINIYFTSFGIGQSAVATPDLTEYKSRTNGAGNTNSSVAVGAGGADDVFVSIKQTSASFPDAYAFADIELKADLDPAEDFLKYTDHEINTGGGAAGPKKNHIVAVNIANATNIDEIYAEIGNAINITTATNSDAIKPFDGMISAVHDATANTLALTYNVPVKADNYKNVLNKVLLPLPGARYNFTGLRPSAAQHTHRLIPISDITPVASADEALTTRLNTVFENTRVAVTIDGSAWGYSGFNQITGDDSNTIKLTQQGKGIAGNVLIASTADTSLITTLGFIDGESAIYGDGDTVNEPVDVNKNSFSKLEITCDATSIGSHNGKTLQISIAGLAYSAALNTSVAVGSSTQTVIGVNSVGSNNSLADALINSLTHSSSAFASEITRGNITVAEKDSGSNAHIVVISAKNGFHIGGSTPIPTGTAVGVSFNVTLDWSGADLVKITGSPLKRKSVQKGVVENDPEDVDTLKFASISASGNTARFYAPFIDAQDKKFLLGTDIDAGSDYYSKVFFGAGEGPSKSPKFTLSENSDIVVQSVAQTTIFDIVSHDGDNKCTLGAQASSDFTYTGVSTKVLSTATGHTGGSNTSFEVDDELPGFTASSTRRIDMTTEIQAGNTVHIRYAAASFDSQRSDSGSPAKVAPLLRTAEGLLAENADSSDDGIFVQASIDGGNSYQDIHTLFTTTIDNVAVTNSELFDANSAGAAFPIYGSPRFDLAAGTSESDHDTVTNIDSGSGTRYYPLMSFTVTSNVRLRFTQKSWSSLSASFDHWWLRFFKIYVVTPGGDAGASSVALTGRANYDQTAIASNVEIRGAKYGLISPIKLNTSAIFRAGSFGQVRDMLEQRPLTRTFDGVRVSESPVAVSFQERRSKKPISPEETNSANLDIFCTSSLPYFDGLTKDRTSQQPDLVDEIDVDITV